MDTKYIFCPNCSTRNFADDEFCGVCKKKLSSTVDHNSTQNASVEKPVNWNPLFLVIAAIVGFYLVFTDTGKGDSTSSSDNSYNESRQRSIYYINKESYATMDKSDFDEMYNYVNNNDIHALRTMVNNGQIAVLPEGAEISIEEVHFGYDVIRVRGYTQKLWVATERISKY